MSETPAVVWFRNDLRLRDNAALTAAIKRGAPIIPVFIWAPQEENPWAPGAASRWWLHRSLVELRQSLEQRGGQLVLREGNSSNELHEIVRETQAGAVYWNQRYEPAIAERDLQLQRALRSLGCDVQVFDNGLLTDPQTVRNTSGKPFQVFTPFWKSCVALLDPAAPLPAPRHFKLPQKLPSSVPIQAFELEPRSNWASGLADAWKPGEAGALFALQKFGRLPLGQYLLNRNRPDLDATSHLSPHLHFGEVTARQVWHTARTFSEKTAPGQASWKTSQFIAEIGWREFAHHLLCHFPQTQSEPLRKEFNNFPCRNQPAWLAAWQQGRTGYPLVDAGMRELWATGWMHNRVRMISASFLIKHLLIPWQQGARWFWDTLVDADLANNTLGWQWTAGCGADAAPFFRIFNPVSQGEKFDPRGDYVRRWIPELANLPGDWIQKPWAAPATLLRQSGVSLGRTYPAPIVEHAAARAKALAAFEKLQRL